MKNYEHMVPNMILPRIRPKYPCASAHNMMSSPLLQDIFHVTRTGQGKKEAETLQGTANHGAKKRKSLSTCREIGEAVITREIAP